MILARLRDILFGTVAFGFCVGSLFCGEIIGALSSLAIILLRKREGELVALL